MDGILLIDKPRGLTSHQVVAIVRRQLGIKKVGHAGTLDPLATGLLVVMVGKATKLSNQLTGQFKVYEAEMKLFQTTDTGDMAGTIINQQKPQIFTLSQVQTALNFFNNYTYWQTPPLYSAIKIKGKKLYEYARQGLKVEIPPREVIISSLKLVEYNPLEGKIKLITECSKGTYIRSLVQDIAQKLGTIAILSHLRRVSSGPFHLSQAINLAEVDKTKITKFIKTP
ncbi:MAG: tRNA pseudouridine(55) synthase TruB [Candidatus Moeniiplasma glomeromycotorum]|nr:tRNA pseudouridine(55) synthase TruB [Candidatus Moeniiplasma glomeromycotorum]MCE8167993.1 tRNA pseudouridine(55) synthase TruB [Candidatus Moeniiplasma glomeromycotorum]MCE8169514.1 tRNA pseudouridine(55) synthase TruB [Candidatus Moeniiplasma glomeromycotorum]